MQQEILLTPGPLTTDLKTKLVMLRDYGSREADFIEITLSILKSLKRLSNLPSSMECVLMQGSSTFSIEATLGTLLNEKHRLLVLVNGDYGRRIQQIAERLGINVKELLFSALLPVDPVQVENFLKENREITHIAIVHCETSSGILNPIDEVSQLAVSYGIKLIVDGVSAFGALEVDLANLKVEAYIASPNKCLESVPGFGFVFVNLESLKESKGNSRSTCLDLYEQWSVFDRTKQFRFTPPTHTIVALSKSLELLEEEGGVENRLARYTRNKELIIEGLNTCGFQLAIDVKYASSVILVFQSIDLISFEELHEKLKKKGVVIYPGKLVEKTTFRIGCIGAVYEKDIRKMLTALAEIMLEVRANKSF